MLPDAVADALSGGGLGFVGLRDAAMMPQAHRAYAWELDADRAHVRFLVPLDFAAGFDEAVADNGEGALTVTQPATAITYQLKGRIVATEPPSEADEQRARHYAKRVMAGLGELYGQDMSAYEDMVDSPYRVAVLAIREAFDQTPGPNAGAAIPLGEGTR